MKHKTKRNIFKLTNVCMCVKQVNWLRGDCVLKLKQNSWCEAGNVISKLWTSQATKKGSVISSAEPMGAHR